MREAIWKQVIDGRQQVKYNKIQPIMACSKIRIIIDHWDDVLSTASQYTKTTKN